jgi:hypothetical protein
LLVIAIATLGLGSDARATTRLSLTFIGGSLTPKQGGGADAENYFEQPTQQGPAPFLASAESASSPAGSSNSVASVGYGWARGTAAVIHSFTPNGILSTSSGHTQSAFRDDITITAPGQSGSGSVIFRIDVEGSMAVDSIDQSLTSADAGWQVVAGGNFIAEGYLFYGLLGPGGDRGFLMTGDQQGGSYEYPVAFQFGVPVQIAVALNIDARVDFCCSAASNFGSSLTWGGVVELRDSMGEVVSEFSIASGSGANYGESIPVPEPGSTALAGCAAMALAGLRSQRRGASPR